MRRGASGLTEAMQSSAFQQVYTSNGAAIYRLNALPVQPRPGFSVQSQQVTARAILLCGVLAASLLAQKKPITIDTVMEQRREAETPAPVWAPDGKHFAYFQGGEVRLYDVAAKSEKVAALARAARKGRDSSCRSRRDSTGKTAG